jgi:uncharacterized protein (TIGR03083 family)
VGVSTPDHLAHLRRELDRFETHLGGDLTAPVEHCGDWTLLELAEHLGRSNRWAAGAVTERRPDYPTERAPRDPAAVAAWFHEGSTILLAALNVDPSTEAWTFYPPRTVAFWRRRRCFEALIHRWDAEHALGLDAQGLARLDPALAGDGVAEVFDTMAPFQIGRGRAAEPSLAVCFVATDIGSSWLFGPDEPVATVSATAADLLLLLWNRRPHDHPSIAWTGDEDAARAVLNGGYTP